jgi:pimeloyl-ACP methyl ester carboxylesterase
MSTSLPASRQVKTKVGLLHVEDRGSGKAVFCWPSLFADARTLDVLVDDLARDHRVLVVDGPGHGKSEAPTETFTLADCADAAIRILDDAGITQATWIGAAWGGHVGVAAALSHPERLERLVMLNVPMAPWRGRRRALMRLSQMLLYLFGPRSFVARILADKAIARSAGPDRDAIVACFEQAARRCDPRGLSVAMKSAMFRREDLIPRLHEIRVPTLFFAGTEDDIFPLEEAREQASAIKNCRFVAVERSAHHSAVERPDVVLPIVREALSCRSARPDQAAEPTP